MWFAFLSWLLWYSILFFFGSRLLWVAPHHLCAFAFLSWLLWDSLYCLRVPDSLGLFNPLCALLFCLGFSGTTFVLLCSRLLLVPPRPLCAFAFLSWLLWDSFYCLSVPASLGPLNPLCALLFCVGFSGTTFVLLGSRASLSPSPPLVCFCFSVLASLGQLLFC